MSGLVDEARRHLAGGRVTEAAAVLRGSGPGAPEAMALLGALCYLEDDFEEARLRWEDAFEAFRVMGRVREAARVAASLADLHGAGLGNLAAGRGWVARGRRVLARADRCVEVGYLELAMVACLNGDVIEVERSADRALAVALEFFDPELEVRALADGGLALVCQGREREGFERLDEAMAAMSGRRVRDPGVLGKSLCAVLSACDRAGDLPRAEECTRLAEEVLIGPLDGRPRIIKTHCREAYGSVLCGLGRWAEAEGVLGEALGAGGTSSAYHRMVLSCRLADLRILQGRLSEAAGLVAPWRDWADAWGVRARLCRATGEFDLAASLAVAGLDALNGDVLRGVPLVALLVEIELDRGDPAAAARAAEKLPDLVACTEIGTLRAEAFLAQGRVALAAEHPVEAIRYVGAARLAVQDAGRPVLAAEIAAFSARAFAASGQVRLAAAEAGRAFEIFCGLGARPGADRMAALLRELGLPARARSGPPDPAGLIGVLTRRERDVLELVCEGLTNPEIGRRLYITPKTVEHHVSRLLTKLSVRTRTQAAALCGRVPPAPAATP